MEAVQAVVTRADHTFTDGCSSPVHPISVDRIGFGLDFLMLRQTETDHYILRLIRSSMLPTSGTFKFQLLATMVSLDHPLALLHPINQ